tara:strand:+ start:2653 stop:2880 length:228 start_codon:yes stop_codon:yes gene_type:complete
VWREEMNIGDLVKLKGFAKTHRNDIPHGIITADLGLNKYKVKWLNPDIAQRWAIAVIVPQEKLELINSSSTALSS